jgi:hypothetical protein
MLFDFLIFLLLNGTPDTFLRVGGCKHGLHNNTIDICLYTVHIRY